ncbi:hypothetical protein LCGC14_2278470 [marine sediment metagenome]|uniref:Uncharacterized protein n=1 Tax=marine sediment metagenome TaxID=412755 RepID=A0A0F9F796_9ZZZZ
MSLICEKKIVKKKSVILDAELRAIGRTQKWFADRCGVSPHTVQGWVDREEAPINYVYLLQNLVLASFGRRRS